MHEINNIQVSTFCYTGTTIHKNQVTYPLFVAPTILTQNSLRNFECTQFLQYYSSTKPSQALKLNSARQVKNCRSKAVSASFEGSRGETMALAMAMLWTGDRDRRYSASCSLAGNILTAHAASDRLAGGVRGEEKVCNSPGHLQGARVWSHPLASVDAGDGRRMIGASH